MISGHSIILNWRPLAIGNRLAIDTGAFYPTGRLSLVDPVSWRYWQVGWRKDLKRPRFSVAARRLPVPLNSWQLRALGLMPREAD